MVPPKVRNWRRKRTAHARKKQPEPNGDEQSLKEQIQIKELQRQLALSELKVEALETMIDIAKEQLKLDIRKKSGAKQSKR